MSQAKASLSKTLLIDAAGLTAIAWLANLLGVVSPWHYPFVYCWLAPGLCWLYIKWATVILYVTFAFIGYQMLRGAMFKALAGFAVAIIIFEIPNLAAHLFNVGGSCG